jgi:hypothetical protein
MKEKSVNALQRIETTPTPENLAGEINHYHAKCEEAAGQAVSCAKEAGDRLLKAKESLGHGQWTAWLQKNFEGAPRTAQAYMRIANNWGELQQKRSSASHLSIRGALGELSSSVGSSEEEASFDMELLAIRERLACADTLQEVAAAVRMSGELYHRKAEVSVRTAREGGQKVLELEEFAAESGLVALQRKMLSASVPADMLEQWRVVASIPEDKFESFIEKCRPPSTKELTIAAVVNFGLAERTKAYRRRRARV